MLQELRYRDYNKSGENSSVARKIQLIDKAFSRFGSKVHSLVAVSTRCVCYDIVAFSLLRSYKQKSIELYIAAATMEGLDVESVP